VQPGPAEWPADRRSAQVHTATLKSTGKKVVIKVIRPDILPVIKADMKLISGRMTLITTFLPVDFSVAV
jgi:predicted unusual protein kinase regulating ubiquinone biosynthesis (AarF/ABC1/UbiB family)